MSLIGLADNYVEIYSIIIQELFTFVANVYLGKLIRVVNTKTSVNIKATEEVLY